MLCVFALCGQFERFNAFISTLPSEHLTVNSPYGAISPAYSLDSLERHCEIIAFFGRSVKLRYCSQRENKAKNIKTSWLQSIGLTSTSEGRSNWEISTLAWENWERKKMPTSWDGLMCCVVYERRAMCKCIKAILRINRVTWHTIILAAFDLQLIDIIW